jgi:protoheme IX farnesyltransferase
MLSTIKNYYYMTKPGIVRGNVLTVIAGFLLASRGQIDLWTFVGVVLGTALVIASACVANNYIDRHIDKKMERTKKRSSQVA